MTVYTILFHSLSHTSNCSLTIISITKWYFPDGRFELIYWLAHLGIECDSDTNILFYSTYYGCSHNVKKLIEVVSHLQVGSPSVLKLGSKRTVEWVENNKTLSAGQILVNNVPKAWIAYCNVTKENRGTRCRKFWLMSFTHYTDIGRRCKVTSSLLIRVYRRTTLPSLQLYERITISQLWYGLNHILWRNILSFEWLIRSRYNLSLSTFYCWGENRSSHFKYTCSWLNSNSDEGIPIRLQILLISSVTWTLPSRDLSLNARSFWCFGVVCGRCYSIVEHNNIHL